MEALILSMIFFRDLLSGGKSLKNTHKYLKESLRITKNCEFSEIISSLKYPSIVVQVNDRHLRTKDVSSGDEWRTNNAMFSELPTWKKYGCCRGKNRWTVQARRRRIKLCFKACLEEWTEKTRRTVALVNSYNTHSPVAAFFWPFYVNFFWSLTATYLQLAEKNERKCPFTGEWWSLKLQLSGLK